MASTVSFEPIRAFFTEVWSALSDCFYFIWMIVLKKMDEVDIYLFVERDLRECNLDSKDNSVGDRLTSCSMDYCSLS